MVNKFVPNKPTTPSRLKVMNGSKSQGNSSTNELASAYFNVINGSNDLNTKGNHNKIIVVIEDPSF